MHHPVPSFPSSVKLEIYPHHPHHPPSSIPNFDYNFNYSSGHHTINTAHTHSTSISSPSPSTGSSVNMAKRPLSDSDCEDLFTDTKDSCINSPGSGTGGGPNVSRKKRRGIIEKRRRDRINNSLSELRRLVPTAFEKQGSAKLEKAEILEMTTQYLKMLQAKGLDALACDPHKYAMDYHSIGFRECAAEVARYLVTVEGMEIQDPLRLRLMSHLQCFAAQRELANKQASASSWGLNPLTPNHSYPPLTPTHHLPSATANAANSGGLTTPIQPGTQHPSSTLMDGSPSNHHQNYLNTSSSSSSGSSSHTSPVMGHDGSIINQGHIQMGQRTLFPPPPGHPHSGHIPREYNPNGAPMTSSPYAMPNHQSYPVQSGKPYRPWGAELAY